METIYDVNFLIKKFEAIPENKWITNKFKNSEGACCAQGHCGMNGDNAWNIWSYKGINLEAETLVKLFEDFSGYKSVAEINNGNNPDYQQETPKQRVLAALYDIKAKQEDKAVLLENTPKERIVYVTVDKEVRKLQDIELVLN